MDEKEFRNFYQNNIHKIYKFFYFKTLSKEVAEDLTSQTFLNFIGSIKGQVEINSFESYLRGIAKNIFCQFLRDKYDSPIDQFAEIDFEYYIDRFTEEVQSRSSLEDRVAPYIELLPESQKVIAQLRFIQKLELKEICQELGKDMNYVKTTQKRAIASLKKLVACTP